MEENSRKCYICTADTLYYWRNIFTLMTKHSDTPIYKILERITGMEFVQLEGSHNTVICHPCFLKIDEYDLAVKTVEKIELEFISMLNRSDKDTEIIVEMIKNEDEIVEACFQESLLFEKSLENVSGPEDRGVPVRNRSDRSESKKRGRPKKLLNVEEVMMETIEEIQEIREDKSLNNESEESHLVETYTLIEDVEGGSKLVRALPESHDEKNRISRKPEIHDLRIINEKDQRIKRTSKRGEKLPNRQTLHPIKCPKCSKDFLARSEFKLHLKTHEDDHRVICYICGATYKSKSALAIHMGMHNGVSPFECSICKKKFTQKGALVRHMPIHTGEKPYQCERCGKQFIHYSSFHMHQLSHDDIRTKKCPICGLQLRSNSHLNRHMRVHSGEKPYACPVCGQKFAQRYNMTSHYKTHMGIHRKYKKTYSCIDCSSVFKYKKKLCEHMFDAHQSTPTQVSVITESSIKVESL
uniref:Putative c2h2-type zn-finger protein n=1 Tax=Phlebotomus kandelakii TaxID=1109342 RepID=A0A6B2E5I3_9DIPT